MAQRTIEVVIEIYESQVEAMFITGGEVIRFYARDFAGSADPDDRNWAGLISDLTAAIDGWRSRDGRTKEQAEYDGG